MEKQELKCGKVDKIVRALRAEIRRLTREPSWSNDWSGESSLPDYSHVQTQLEALLEAGHADEVLALGEELWRRGNEQIGQSQDEGETGQEIGDCMDVVLRAVPQSSLKPAEQLLWIIDACMNDEYGVLDEQWHRMSETRYGKDDWNVVADTFVQRLASMPKRAKEDTFHTEYERGHVMRWLISALEYAEREAEIIPLLEREAPITNCYEELVDRLILARRKDEARQWAVEGFRKTSGRFDGIARHLEEKLRKMAERDKDLPTVAAYRAWEFFDEPALTGYLALQKAAEAVNLWAPVRDAVMRFLEEGIRPDVPAGEKAGKAVRPSGTWPLPTLDIPASPEEPSHADYPDTGTLIDIALREKRHDDAIRWLNVARKKSPWHRDRDESVAEAVQETHPDVSLRIWKDKAEEQIAQVKPVAYEEAAQYLRLMRKVYEKTKRVGEWENYLAALRTQHKPKRSLMKILDSLEGKKVSKRIIDSR